MALAFHDSELPSFLNFGNKKYKKKIINQPTKQPTNQSNYHFSFFFLPKGSTSMQPFQIRDWKSTF